MPQNGCLPSCGTNPDDLKKKELTLRGFDAYKARLRNGQNIRFRESGNSMVPKIYSRQECEYTPVTCPEQVEEGDIVWCKVKGNHYTHLVHSKKREGDGWRFKIGNNKGGVNGWVGIENIFAKVVSVEGRVI